MSHIDYQQVSSLDALIDISDAAARATLVRLRERLEQLGDLDARVIYDGHHHKPVLAYFLGADALLHVYPEPNVSLGLHCALPIRDSEEEFLDLAGLDDRVREAVSRARPHHNMIWVELILRAPSQADDVMDLIERRIDLLPRIR